MIKCIQENIFRHGLFGHGSKIVVGCSGGPDSVCLLDILSKLQKKYKLELVVAHVNYGLRGNDASRDEKFVTNLAKKYSLPLEILKVKISKKSSNLEERLREIRYEFFEKIRNKFEADRIAVGHNLNDQAETVMLRILRGTGLRGLGAIRFKNNFVVRPLLNVSRKEILGYLRKNKMRYRTDKTNLGTDFTRNKVRNALFPYIKKSFNPNIEQILYKFSQSAADDYDFLERYSKLWLVANKNLRVSKLNTLHPSIQRLVIRLFIEKHKLNLRQIESSHVEEAIKVVKSNKNKRQRITFKGLKIERKGDRLVISRIT